MRTRLSIAFALLALMCAPYAVQAQIRLPKLISDGMVLQRDTDLTLWGWAKPGEKVTVTFNQAKYSTTTNGQGEWQLKLPAQKAGGPYTLELSASNTITLRDVLVGDVWVCSGQSNMELPMRRVQPLYEAEIAKPTTSISATLRCRRSMILKPHRPT